MRTNRDWLNSLSDKELGQFFSDGVEVERVLGDARVKLHFSVNDLARQFAQVDVGVEKWLSAKCNFVNKEKIYDRRK